MRNRRAIPSSIATPPRPEKPSPEASPEGCLNNMLFTAALVEQSAHQPLQDLPTARHISRVLCRDGPLARIGPGSWLHPSPDHPPAKRYRMDGLLLSPLP